MATNVVSGSRPGGSAVTTSTVGGTFQIAGVGTVRARTPPVNLSAALAATSRASSALSIQVLPHGTNVLSAARPGAGSAVVRASVYAAFQISGVGITATPIPLPSGTVLVGASLMATSRGSAATPGLHINLAGQIKAASRAAAYLPGTMSLTGRITTRSDARCVSLPPPPRSVLTGWARATSGAAAYATTTSVRTRQNDVSVITS